MPYVIVTYIYSCREMNSQASKVFLTSDFCENRYLCFLVESHQHLRSTININISDIWNSMHILGTIEKVTMIILVLCFYTETLRFFSPCFYRCVRFIESNDTSQLIFASVTTIPAKDAEPLQVIIIII